MSQLTEISQVLGPVHAFLWLLGKPAHVPAVGSLLSTVPKMGREISHSAGDYPGHPQLITLRHRKAIPQVWDFGLFAIQKVASGPR
jgi:PTS system trehalose-specific IIC component